jgi:hypothetical protein
MKPLPQYLEYRAISQRRKFRFFHHVFRNHIERTSQIGLSNRVVNQSRIRIRI